MKRLVVDKDLIRLFNDGVGVLTVTSNNNWQMCCEWCEVYSPENPHFTARADMESGITCLGFNEYGDYAYIQGGYPNPENCKPLILQGGSGNVGIGTISPQEKLDVDGTVRTKTLTITGGSDLAEPFVISDDDIEPGMVLSIDPIHAGKLMPSGKAYDKAVIGVVSGAGGVKTGMIMSQQGKLEGGHPVALSGRVYCLCDATMGAIQPGDRLTTSPTKGHAMRVAGNEQASGAVIGKAMSSLKDGKGLVLMVVQPQ